MPTTVNVTGISRWWYFKTLYCTGTSHLRQTYNFLLNNPHTCRTIEATLTKANVTSFSSHFFVFEQRIKNNELLFLYVITWQIARSYFETLCCTWMTQFCEKFLLKWHVTRRIAKRWPKVRTLKYITVQFNTNYKKIGNSF